MASSSIISNLGTISHQDSSIESKKKRRKKNQYQSQNQQQNQTPRWRSSNERQIYSSKLLEALRHVRHSSNNNNNNDSNDNSSSSNTEQSLSSSNSNTTSSLSTAKNGRAIREAADKALAITAKGRTRWSRAILTNRLQLKFKKMKPKVVACRSQKRSFDVYKKKLQPLQPKVKVLRRIVPGCKKLSFPVLLEETTDYIAALEMQVRTMTALTQLLSLAGSSSSSSSASTNHLDDHGL